MSIQFSDIMDGKNSQLNFFLPFSRFWELLIGSALAFFELKYGKVKNSLATQALPVIGIFLIVHSIFLFNSDTPHPSFQTMLPIVGVILVITFCSSDDLIGKVLSFKPIVGVGLISYSLYLWHFPIFAFGRLSGSNPSNYDKLEWIALAFVMSVLSYYVIEKTFRNRTIINTKQNIGFLIAILSTLIFINFNIISNNGYKYRFPQIAYREIVTPWKLLDNLVGKSCHDKLENFCKLGNYNSSKNLVLVGDSLMASINSEFYHNFKDKFKIYFLTNGGCPLILNVKRVTNGKDHICDEKLMKKRFEFINALEGDTTIVYGGWFSHLLNQEKSQFFIAVNDKSVLQNISDTIIKLSDNNKLIVIDPFINFKIHNNKFLLENINNIKKSNFLFPSVDISAYHQENADILNIYDKLTHKKIITRVKVTDIFCVKNGKCIPNKDLDYLYI